MEATAQTAEMLATVTGEGEPFVLRDARQDLHHWVVVLNNNQVNAVREDEGVANVQESHLLYTPPDISYYVVPKDGRNRHAVDRTKALLSSFETTIFRDEDEEEEGGGLQSWRLILSYEQLQQVIAEQGVARVVRWMPGVPTPYTAWNQNEAPLPTTQGLHTVLQEMEHYVANILRLQGRTRAPFGNVSEENGGEEEGDWELDNGPGDLAED